MSQHRDMSGILSKNDRKQKDNHPDISGQCTIGGVQYWISGWKKDGRSGTFYSLAFKPKLAREHQGAPANPPAQTAKSEFDSSIPF